MKFRIFRVLALGLLLITLIAGCAPSAAPAPAISVESAWGRPSMDMVTSGAFYMVIKNSGNAPDRLLSGTSPACGSIEVHEMVMKSDGSMGMNLLDKPLEIPAGDEVELKSGGMHIMCIMKKDAEFAAGANVNLTLVFETSGEITVPVEIREQ